MEIKHVEKEHRFETVVDGVTAVIQYVPFEGGLDLRHTRVPQPIEGRGIAGALTAFALAYVREKGLKIKPSCSYIRIYLERHPEEKDLVVK